MVFSKRLTLFFLWTTLCLFAYNSNCMANPSLLVRFTRNGLEYVSKVLEKNIQKSLMNQKIQNSEKHGKFSYGISNAKFVKVSQPLSNISFVQQSGLQFDFKIDTIELRTRYWMKKKILWFRLRKSGSLHLIFNNNQLSFIVGARKIESGRLVFDFKSCTSSLDIQIKTRSIILRIIYYFLRNQIRSQIQNQICKNMESLAETYLEKAMNIYPVNMRIGKEYIFKNLLIADPIITSEYIETRHLAAIYDKDHQYELPFSPLPLPNNVGKGKMLYIVISNYVFDSWLYALYRKDLLRYTYKNMKIDLMGENNKFEIEIKATDRPRLYFSTNRIHLDIPVKLHFKMLSFNSSLPDSIDIGLNTTLEMKAHIHKNKFSFSVTNVTFDLQRSLNDSELFYDMDDLQAILQKVSTASVRYFNLLLKRVEFPIIIPNSRLQFVPNIRIEKNAMILEIDLKFT